VYYVTDFTDFLLASGIPNILNRLKLLNSRFINMLLMNLNT